MPGRGGGARQLSTPRLVVSYLWAFSPLYALGLTTPFPFVYAAIRRRSWLLGAAAVAYAVAVGVAMVLAGDSSEDNSDVGTILILLMVVGTGHALAIRHAVFAPPPPDRSGLDAARRSLRRKRDYRARAREIAQEDPTMAKELGIGRPDLPRDFDDGGLVDVNHAPASAIATLPGVTSELAARIVRTRETRGRFVSIDELSVFAELPPRLTADLADRLICLP